MTTVGIEWNGSEKYAVSHASWTLKLIAVGFTQTVLNIKNDSFTAGFDFEAYIHGTCEKPERMLLELWSLSHKNLNLGRETDENPEKYLKSFEILEWIIREYKMMKKLNNC